MVNSDNPLSLTLTRAQGPGLPQVLRSQGRGVVGERPEPAPVQILTLTRTLTLTSCLVSHSVPDSPHLEGEAKYHACWAALLSDVKNT